MHPYLQRNPLAEHRTSQGLDLVELAKRSNHQFSASFLQDAERGRIKLDDKTIDSLLDLYQVNTEPVIPQRSELVLDLNHRQLRVGDQSVAFESDGIQDVLTRYVSLIYMLRGLTPGSDLVLRDRDIEVLSRSLGYAPSRVRRSASQRW